MAELFDESHYFNCSQGLKPAALKSSQQAVMREDGKYYLVQYSLKCKGIDFSCKWIALLYAIVAAAIALLMSCPAGWILLAAILGAAAGAALGAAVCGDMAAVMRVWIVIKEDVQFGDQLAVYNKSGPHLTCAAMGGQITYVPNVDSEFHALVLFAGNTLMTGLEGFMYVCAFRGAGMLVTKPLQFFANFGVNYLKTLSLQGLAGRTIFGAWGGFSAYSYSQTEMTSGEAMTSGEVWKAAGSGFGFAEVAAYNAATKGDPQSIALLLSMGGIPSAKGEYSTTRELLDNAKDNFQTDKTMLRMELANELKESVKSYKTAAEKINAGIQSAVDKAKDFRERLKQQKKGKGAHEEGKVVIYKGFGGDIQLDLNRTTTVIGKFEDPINGYGTKEILNMPEGSFTRGGENKGGINILDIPSAEYEGLLKDYGTDIGKEIFWEKYNQPFLEESFKRGDNVRVLSDPNAPENRTGFYERELNEIQKSEGLAEKYGYIYDPKTNSYIKK